MGFTADIPKSGQSLGNSRPQILNNFATLRTAAGSATSSIGDHYDVNNSTNIGKHKWVHFPTVTGGVGVPTTAATEVAIYSKTVSGTAQLYFRKVSSGTEVQLTGAVTYGVNALSSTPVKTGNTCVTFLPGGIVNISGFIQDVDASQQINYPITFSGGVLSIQLTRLATEAPSPSNRSYHQVTASATTSFTFRSLNESGSATAGYNVFFNVTGIL